PSYPPTRRPPRPHLSPYTTLFRSDKSDPSRLSGDFVTDPWSITVEGLAENTGTYSLEEIVSQFEVERRVYRLRCVEAWSMVIPRSEEHTSELQSRENLVCRLLLEK